MAKKINIIKSYEEVEIGDNTYRFSLKDEDLKKAVNLTSNLSKEIKDVNDEDIIISKLKEVMSTIFADEKAGDEIYDACDKSTWVLTNVFAQVFEVISEKAQEAKNNKFAQYIK